MTGRRIVALEPETLDEPGVDEAVETLQYVLQTEFYLFCQYYDREFFSEARPHLETICDGLQLITEKKTKKLMMSLPPRAGKSYTVSLWCAWMIGRGVDDPDTSIMRNSYGGTLAEKFSYDVREMLQSEKFLDVFPKVKLKQDHSRIEDWAIDGATESTYFCAGVGGGITGKGCHTASILDDPIKNMEDALSGVIPQKTWTWVTSTMRARAATGCPEIHIATRWSRRDPIGMILDSAEGEGFMQIVVPALTPEGESFCEAVRTTAEYLETRSTVDEFIWESEYMQNPIEAKGLLYPIEELQKFKLSELTRDRIDAVIGFTDTADEGTDFLASLSVALSGGNAYLVDVVFTQEQVEVTEPLVAQQIIDNGHQRHTVESNSGGKGFARRIKDLIRGKSKCNVTWRPSTVNKETRILMSSGQVKDAFWFRTDYKAGSPYDKFMRQLTSYVKMASNQPDDAPDALTGVAEMVLHPSTLRFLGTEDEG